MKRALLGLPIDPPQLTMSLLGMSSPSRRPAPAVLKSCHHDHHMPLKIQKELDGIGLHIDVPPGQEESDEWLMRDVEEVGGDGHLAPPK